MNKNFIHDTEESLLALRAECELVLGYPKIVDYIGPNVVLDVQPIEHGYAIVKSLDGWVMTVDADLEALASGSYAYARGDISESTRTKLVALLSTATEGFDPDPNEIL